MNEAIHVFGPVSSLQIWRAGMQGFIEAPYKEPVQPDLTRARASVRAFKRLDCVRLLGDIPLDAIVSDPKRSHACKSLDTIVLKGALPPGSFHAMDDGAYVCSPALSFALLARGGASSHLLEIGCELCGTYSMSYRQDGMFINCAKLTSADSIRTYIEQLGRRHGVQAARAAAQSIHDSSDSPRETSMFLAYTQPDAKGGYGFFWLALNAKLELSRRSQLALHKSYLLVDQLFADKKGKPLAVGEYDSNERHLFIPTMRNGQIIDVMKIIADDERREVIRDEGIDVVTVRTEDTRDFERFDAKAMRLAKLIGFEPRPSTGNLATLRRNLMLELFDTRKWEYEYAQLRKMAGYERAIAHPKAWLGA